MAKITGKEHRDELPEKVLKMYQAVIALIQEGADIANVKVSDITEKAGIGKGTAYDYFGSREEIIVYALLFYMGELLSAIEEKAWKLTDFRERLEFTMTTVDEQAEGGICTLRFINLLFETSQTGQLLRETLRGMKNDVKCQPFLLGKRVIEKGIADGEIRSDLPVSYMSYVLVTKFVAYMAMAMREETKIADTEFKEYIIKGILEEFCI